MAEESSGVVVPPPAIYAAGLLAGAGLQRTVPLPEPPPAVARAAGVAGLAGWLALSANSLVRFRRSGTSPLPMRPSTALVTSGPYRLTRNPMYVGFASLYAGVAGWRRLTWALVLLPGVLGVVDRFVIAREERYLERTFGDEYRSYRARVRRWL